MYVIQYLCYAYVILLCNVVYSMSSPEAHTWSRIHFCIISRSPNMPNSANSTNAILSQSIFIDMEVEYMYIWSIKFEHLHNR